MPTISVIVPVYKVEKYIHRCVDSILGQTYADFELILVDDGSPDNCGAICDEYAAKDSRVVVIHQENGGLSAARNAGIDWAFANSDSQWLSFIDSDDWVHPEYLQRLLDAAMEHNVAVSICGYAETSGTFPEISPDTTTPVLWNSEDFYVKDSLHCTYAWGKLYRRDCFQVIRYPVGRLYEDQFTTYKILFHFKSLSVITVPLYAYFTNMDGITKSGIGRFCIDHYDGLVDQIEYFRCAGYQRAERAQICELMLKLQNKLEWFEKNPGANDDFLRLMKQIRRKAILRYVPRLKPSDDLDGWTLTQIFPKTMWFYWRVRAVLRKLRIIK